MNKNKYFVIIGVTTAVLLLSLGNAVASARATSAVISTPTPIGTPTDVIENPPEEVPSAEEQEELKTIVQSYIDTRYRALSISNAEDFKQNGFDSQMSEPSEMT